MKKTIITLTAGVLFMYAAYAQKATVGITAGGTLSNYKIKENGEDLTSDSKLGFTAGLIANIPASKNFMIQTGAHWVQKGTKDEEAGEKVSLTVNSIEIPVNFLYNSNGGFFIGAGPSASFAVSGKWKYNDLSVKTKFGNSEDDDMKGFDFGANVLAGYQSQGGFLIMANFNQGFSNLIPGDAEDAKLKSHYFGIRLGYLLKGKK
jgi:outer membrane immunogenic protein